MISRPMLAACLLLAQGCIVDSLTHEADIATASCESLSELYCRRAIACGGYDSRAECISIFAATWSCPDALSVGVTYPACSKQLEDAECSMVSGWPRADCSESITFLP